jgi:hypothetical protein
MPISLPEVPAADLHAERAIRALPNLPLRLHHPAPEQFVCAGCGLVLVEGVPTVPERPLAFTALRCDCGRHSRFPDESASSIRAA